MAQATLEQTKQNNKNPYWAQESRSQYKWYVNVWMAITCLYDNNVNGKSCLNFLRNGLKDIEKLLVNIDLAPT